MEESPKKEYILHYILKPSMSSDEAHQYRSAMNEKIQGNGGEVKASVCQEAAQRLAYPIARESSGYFCESVFLLQPEHVTALSDTLKHEVQITRYVIKRKEKRAQPKIRKQTRRIPGEKEITSRQPFPTSRPEEKRETVSMEEIDKKLDEIIKNI